jgi:hypothetical protein
MKTNQSNSILALEVKVGNASYSGICVKAHDVETIKERVSNFLSAEQAEKIQYVDAPDANLKAASLEEAWHHVLSSLQII